MTETTQLINRIAEFLERAYGRDALSYFLCRTRMGNRWGQALMHTLSLFDFGSYCQLKGTEEDPQSDDSRLPHVLDTLTNKYPIS